MAGEISKQPTPEVSAPKGPEAGEKPIEARGLEMKVEIVKEAIKEAGNGLIDVAIRVGDAYEENVNRPLNDQAVEGIRGAQKAIKEDIPDKADSISHELQATIKDGTGLAVETAQTVAATVDKAADSISQGIQGSIREGVVGTAVDIDIAAGKVQEGIRNGVESVRETVQDGIGALRVARESIDEALAAREAATKAAEDRRKIETGLKDILKQTGSTEQKRQRVLEMFRSVDPSLISKDIHVNKDGSISEGEAYVKSSAIVDIAGENKKLKHQLHQVLFSISA